MIGLDTNVIVRYVAQDDRSQAAAAARLMEVDLTAENPGFVSLVVLAELVWVLSGAYDADRATIGRVLEGLLSSPRLRIDQAEAAWLALLDYREAGSRMDFSDALIARVASRAGCPRTMTFDRRAARSAGFELLR
jgi:predicted nucleic-acid-binding protein